jgi:hypothetical protein
MLLIGIYGPKKTTNTLNTNVNLENVLIADCVTCANIGTTRLAHLKENGKNILTSYKQ